MAFLPTIENKESTLNKTTTPLSASTAWSGSWEDVSKYSAVAMYNLTDQDGMAYIEFSPDGVNVDSRIPLTIESGSNDVHQKTITRPYVRLYIENTSAQDQTFLRAGLLIGEYGTLTLGLNSTNIPSDWDSIVVRSVGVGQDPLGEYVNTVQGGYTSFDTNTPLSASGTYSSSILDLRTFSQIETSIFSDVGGSLTGSWYSDAEGNNLIRTFTLPYTNSSIGTLVYLSAPVLAPYLKYEYNNGDTDQTTFHTALRLENKAVSGQILGLNDFIPPNVVANLGRNVIAGQDRAGNFKNVPIDSEGNINVDVKSPRTVFGTLAVDELTPVTQLVFTNRLNLDLITTGSNGTTEITQTSSVAYLHSGTTAGSSGSLQSVKRAKYRAGQGVAGRFAGIYITSSVSDSYTRMGVGDDQNGFFFGSSGSAFGIWTRREAIDTFIPQSSWNLDTMDGTGGLANPTNQLLDPSKGNPFALKYQYLGFGAQIFYVEESVSGDLSPVHIVRYSNTFEQTSVSNPTLPFHAELSNGSGTDDVGIKIGSVGLFNEGKVKITGPTNVYKRAIASANGIVHLFTLRNKSTVGAQLNNDRIVLSWFSAVTDGNAGVTFEVYQNATIVGDNYGDVGTESIVEVTEDGTYTDTTGKLIGSFGLGKVDSLFEKIKELEYELPPNNTLTFIMRADGVNAGSSFTIAWVEDI